jgi:hypothetical protein
VGHGGREIRHRPRSQNQYTPASRLAPLVAFGLGLRILAARASATTDSTPIAAVVGVIAEIPRACQKPGELDRGDARSAELGRVNASRPSAALWQRDTMTERCPRGIDSPHACPVLLGTHSRRQDSSASVTSSCSYSITVRTQATLNEQRVWARAALPLDEEQGSDPCARVHAFHRDTSLTHLVLFLKSAVSGSLIKSAGMATDGACQGR